MITMDGLSFLQLHFIDLVLVSKKKYSVLKYVRVESLSVLNSGCHMLIVCADILHITLCECYLLLYPTLAYISVSELTY
jgi:hypothetical protein